MVLVFAVGLAAAGSAGSGASLNVTVAVIDGFGAGLSCGRHIALSNSRQEGCQTPSRMWMDLCSNSYYKAAVSSHAEGQREGKHHIETQGKAQRVLWRLSAVIAAISPVRRT